jgi:hypothetical protein
MKSFKDLLSEVAAPKPEEEKKFKDQHKVDIAPHPVSTEFQHKGTVKPKAKRKADQEGDANYDAAYTAESVEELDEKKISKGMQAYIDISNKKADATSKEVKGSIERVAAAMRAKRMKKEEVEELDESVTKMSHSRLKFHMNTGTPHGSYSKDEMKAERDRRLNAGEGEAYKKAKASMSEEIEQVDEISRDLAQRYIRKASAYKKTGEKKNKDRSAGIELAGKKTWDGFGKPRVKATESVEQLDELSPNTLHSYIKKAAGNMAGNAAVAAAQASSSMKKSSPDVKRKIKNRMQGITGASGRLADKANMAENWQEEIPMMMRQLEFIAYAAEEIMDYVEMAGDPEEWFQNKISGIHQSMLSMYAYAQGGRRAGYGFDESVEEELKGGQKKLDHNKNGKIDAQDFHMMRKKKKNEEAEQIDEISQDKLQSYHAKAALDLRKKREKLDKGTLTMKDLKKGQNRVTGLNRAANKMEEVESLTQMLDEAVNVKGIQKAVDDGKSIDVIMTMFANKRTTNTDEIRKVVKDYNWKKRIKKEEVEMLDETFKQGVVKLKDGGSVVLKKEDADLLNQMFKDLSAGNRKKMQEVAMKDKSGFEEILGFAREAL